MAAGRQFWGAGVPPGPQVSRTPVSAGPQSDCVPSLPVETATENSNAKANEKAQSLLSALPKDAPSQRAMNLANTLYTRVSCNTTVVC